MASLIGFSKFFIDIEVSISGMSKWRLTCFYGHPERNNRSASWTMLRGLAVKSSLPWCCLGDFNDLLSQSKKHGRIPHPLYLVNGFRPAINHCGLVDLGMKGHQFTWEKGRGSINFVEERLDRVLATNQ